MSKVTFRVADLNNGPFSEEFSSLEQAEKFMQDEIEVGIKIQLEDNEELDEPLSEEEVLEKVRDFLYIVRFTTSVDEDGDEVVEEEVI